MRVFKSILVLALSFCMLLSLLTLNVCAEKKIYEGVELTVVSTVGPFTSGPIKDHAPEWTEMTGGKVKLIEVFTKDV